jgi:hypothetical protein
LGFGIIVEGLRIFHNRDFGVIGDGIVKGNTVFDSGTGISVSGTVTGNNVISNKNTGIFVFGTASGNNASFNGTGIEAGTGGNTLIGNTAYGNAEGLVVVCPSNLTDNTAVNNGTNLVLIGTDCHNEDNLAP